MNAPRPLAPQSLRLSLLAWSVAIAAGIFETALSLTAEVTAGATVPDLLPALLSRVALYLGASLLVLALRGGRRWARTVLTVLLSLLGLASLAVPLTLEALAGQLPALEFLTVRLLHIAAVLIATASMYTSAATAWLRGR
ncbi:hypothetical protein [Brachybacterium sacelli]|uniref:DUF4149 domain-containing protein n=1 Tax=Brachybacterium sacelli TaxID=173364 RepID=A0ABS4X3A1_9MICO|nr:hypothetical protein [Brachybacterium sacelli]MBP2382224.1 hypothetical protein [Brachybacterium sacelli]